MFFKKIILCCILLINSVFSSEDLIVDSRLSNKIVYSNKPLPWFKDFCKFSIDKILNNEVGKKLTERISAYLLKNENLKKSETRFKQI